MKLHLPVKLRASLIAAVIAVSASMYNARAVDYVAPSDTFGWTSNDMTLTERYLATSGNTYTAVSSEYYVFKTYADNPNVRVAYATINGQVTELDYNGAAYSHNGQGVDPEGYYVLGTANGSMDETYIPVTVAGNGPWAGPLEVTAANAGDTPTKKNDPAIITIAATTPTSGSLVSVMGDKSSFTTNGALEIDNSVKSAEGYTGDVTIDTNSIVIKPDSQGAGSTVVLEDVTISDYDEDGDTTAISTQIGDNSKLVIVDGNVANVTDEARTQMNLEDISSSEGVEYGQNSVNLGAVSGTGSLTIVGDKDAEGNSSLDVDIASISGTGSAAFGEVNVANADADVAGSVSNATTVSLSNSQTNVGGGVITRGLNVDGAATLAAQGMVSNLNNQGAGHVNISGTVTSENGSINLTNGKANEGLGVKEGSVLEAGQDILLSNVDAVAPGSLKAEGSLTLTSDASLQNAGKDEEGNDRVSVGNDLLVGGGSSISNSSLTVGGDVQVTDQLTGYTSDAEASTLTDSAITVKPKEGESSTVTIANGSSATDTTIIGADGDIAVTGKVNADKGVTKTTVSGTKGTTNFISSVDEAGNVTERKGALADTLTALKAGSEEGLTMSPADKKAALEEAGYQVTSMIGNTKGNVSINNADVTGTVVTGGGNVEIGDTTGTANTNADLMAQIRKQLPVLDGIGDIEGKFSTYVDGSIIDVRGNLNADPKLENDLTIGDAAVTNTIILGITGDIKVSHAVLDNDYIDGGKGLDLDDVIIIDTPIVNMEADIKLTNSTITGTTEGGFVLNTLGTADYIDKDAYTGGSILLDGATLQNGVIKSGYRATYTEDGFVWTKQESEKLAQVMGASGLEDLDGVTKLPYGEVSIKNSTLKSMDVETVAGNIELNGKENNVENDLNAAAGASNSVSNGIKSFSTSLITLGGADESTVLKSITVQERGTGSHQQASGPVKLVIRDAQGNQIASSTNSVTMSNQSANRTWTFDSVALDPTQVYTYAFVNENGSEITKGVGLNLIENGGVSTDKYGSSYGAIVSAVVSPGRDNPDAYTNHILGASIATGNGALNAVRTYMDSLTTTSGEGEEAVTTVTKTTLTATKDSQLNASYAKGTDITIHDDAEGAAPNLSIYNSVLRGDVTMDVDGWVTVDGNSDVALDGYAAGKTDADGNAVKDAGITATVLRLEVLKGDAASITNGEVHIAEATMLRDRPSIDGHVNTLTLSATSGQLGNLFDEMDIHPDAQNQNPYGGATVHIKDGSDISTGIIATGTTKDGQAPTDHGDTSLNKSYFGHIFVEGDSKLTATDTAIIKDYKENVNVGDAYSKFKGADAEGSSVVFEKDAWLTDAHIIGLNNRPTGKYGVKATGPITSTTINGDAHIGTLRLDSEAVLNLVNKGEESVTSYIANIKPGFDDTYYVGAEKGAAHGTINVVNETLVTPDLNKADNRGESYLSLGLNGATVELGSVTAEQGATVASDSAVNPHVHVREITNAVIAGAPAVDKTPGKSTIRTTLNRFLSGSVEATTGEAAQGSVKSFYYVARNTGEDGWTPTDGTYYKYDAAAGTLTEVDTIHDGDIIVKKDSLESKELAKLDGSNETVVTGVVADSGVTLDATEVGYLDRITVPVVDESGNVVYNTVDQNVPLNQPYTEESVTIFPDAAGSIPGVVESKTDGIASLTVDQDFDADNTVINAYQIGVQDADAGTTTADENSGFITIKGDLTGQDNELTADKDIRIGGIVAAPTTFGDFETSAMVVNANEVTSLGGDITIGSNGIVGQQNTVTAQTGSVVVEGSVKGWSNTIDGAVSAEVKGGLLKESQTKVVGENETTLSVSANYNIVTSKGNVSIGADAASGDSIQGSNNNITSTEEGDVIIAGTTRGDSNLISAVLGNVTTNAIVGNQNTIKTDGGKVTTQDITGNTNTITAKVPEGTELAEGDTSTGSVSTGTVTGDSNTITAENEAWVEAIVGDQNSVTAQNDILIDGGILPTLDAAGNVTATSDNNTILSHAGNVELGASETWVTTGDDDRFETAGYPLTSIFGDHNTVTAEAGDIYAEGNVSGNSNSLTAQKTEAEDGTVTGGNILLDQVNANIIGDENSLKADAAITTATIQGNENVLTAGTSIKTGDITDDTATGHITGDLNQLTAGEDITVDGDITGNENTLTAGTTLTVAGTVSGADNTLTGAGDVSVGGVEGEGNLISSTGGDVTVNGDVIGSDVDGDGNVDSNALIAHDRVVVEGTVAGENTMIIAYASGLSQDDVAISIGTFAAQGTDLRIATTSDPVYGVTNGNGAILIDTMAAAQQWVDGELVPAEVDADLVNHIISNNSYVLIGQMEGSNAYTQITAAKDVIIGSPVDTLGLPHDDTASHLTITAKNLQINNQSLTLTDSVVNVTGSITGASLTLTTSADQQFVSTAANVTLDSLTVRENAHLNATGAITLENLTIDGTLAGISGSSLKVTNTLTLMNGAALAAFNISAPNLAVINSSVNTERLLGLKGLTVTGSTVSVTQGLTGLTNDVIAQSVYIDAEGKAIVDANNNPVMEGELIDGATEKRAYLTAESIGTTGNVLASNASIVSRSTISAKDITATNGGLIEAAGDITATGALAVNGGSTITTSGKLSGTSLTANNGTVKATQGIALNTGKLDASQGSSLTGDVLSAGDVSLTGGSTLTGSVKDMTGSLTVTGVEGGAQSVISGSVAGATSAELKNASTGSLTMGGVVTEEGGETDNTADVTLTDGSTVNGSIAKADDVTVTDSNVTGSISMDGALKVTRGDTGKVTGATGATLLDAAIRESLGMSGILDATRSTVSAIDGTLASADIKDHSVIGSGFTATGTVQVSDSEVQGDITSTTETITVNNGSIKGSLTTLGTGKGITVQNGSTVGGALTTKGEASVSDSVVTGKVKADAATLTNASVGGVETDGLLTTNGSVSSTGNVTAKGGLTVNNGILNAGSNTVDVTGKTTLNAGVVQAGTFNTDGLEVVNVNGNIGELTSDGDFTITGGDLKFTGITINAGDGIHNTTNGALTLKGGAQVTSSGAATVADKTVVKENSSLSGTTLSTHGLEVMDGTVTMAGVVGSDAAPINLNSGALTVDGGSVKGNIANATNVDLDDAVVDGIVMNGTLHADNSVTGAISGTISTADVVNSTIGSGLTASGYVNVSAGSKVGGTVKSTGSTVDVTASTITGKVDASTTATVTGSTVGQGVSGSTVTVTDSVVQSGGVSGTDTTVTDSTITGDVSGSTSATVSGGSVAGNVSGGTVETTGTAITGNVSGSTSVTVNGGTVDGKVVGGSIADGGAATSNANATVNGATVGQGVSGSTVKVTDSIVQNGGVSGMDTTVTDSTIAGDVSGTTSATVSGGSVTGSVSGGAVTLTETTISTNVKADSSLTTNGDVLVGTRDEQGNVIGTVTVGSETQQGSLTVNNGTLSSGTVTVHGQTTLNNGVVDAGSFTTEGITMNQVQGTINGDLDAGTGDIDLNGDSLTVKGDIDGGSLDLDGQLLDNTGKAIRVDEDATIKNGSTLITGSLTVNQTEDGQKGTLTDADTGLEVDASTVKVSGTVDLNGTDMKVSGGSNVSATTITEADDVTLEDATVNANLTQVSGDVTLSKDSELNGNIGTDTDRTAKNVTVTGSDVNGSIYMSGELEVTGGSSVDNVTGTSKATVTGSSAGSLTMGSVTDEATEVTTYGDVTIDQNSTVASIANAGDVSVTGDSVVSGETGMHGDLEVTNATVANVKGAMGATLTDAHAGDLTMGSETVTVDGEETTTYGTVTATGSSIGTVTNAGDVTVTDTTAKDITFAEGSLTATDSRLGDVSNAKGSDITGSVEVDSLGTGDLTVHKDASLTSTDEGGITANGALSIEGGVTAKQGDISLTGTADKDGNKSKVSSADVTAEQGTLTLAGEIDATDSTLTGKEGVVLNGTLNAAEGVAFEGKLTGKGTINKTGGDTLELAGTTNLEKGAVNVSDNSTLDAGDGAHLGKLKLTDGAMLEVAGEGIGGVSASSLTMDSSAAINTDADLAAGKADRVTVAGAADLKGATVNLRTDEALNEAAVADQSRLTIVEAGSVVSSVNEDVAHGLDTLNVHAENTGSTVDLVFSKNYKGVEGKTFNQSQAAAGLASLEHLQPGGELAEVMDALHHTRSGADALAALDSLGGAGLAGVQKVVADDTKEHLQTLRSTIKSTAAGVQYRYDEYGQRIPDKDSNALSGTVTGGHSEVSGSGNCGKYERDSIGFMLAYVHALPNKDWKFGGDLAYSYADASCASTTIKSDVVYLDLALTHDRGRFHQMGTLGVALFSIDTERDASVKAAGHQYAGHADGSTDAVEFNVSYEMNYDLVVKDQHRLSSVVMAEATFAQFDTMTESGMGNAGLTSEWDDMASLTFGLGARYTYSFGEERNPGYFAAEALFVAETGDTMPKVSNSFIGGGAAFDQEGPDAGDCGLRLNAGVLIPLGDQWGVFGNVTSEFRENQTSVGGGVGVKCSF